MMKEYKKVIKNLQPFFEAHHSDIHERLDLIVNTLCRLEVKVDMLDQKLKDSPSNCGGLIDEPITPDAIDDLLYNADVAASKPDDFDVLGGK